MSGQERAENTSTARHWDSAYRGFASAEGREAFYALSSRLYQLRYTNPYFSDDGTDWVEWVRRTVAPDAPLERGLVLGCGLGDGLLDFHRRGIARRLHGVDLSEEAIEQARAGAERAGLGEVVTFEVGDFDRCREPGAYDVVVMVMSLHHSLDLDRTLAAAREALRPSGWFVANEYIGPTRWQYTDLQVRLVNALLSVLPKDLRRRGDGTLKESIERPGIDWMIATDPSEAAHSEEIPDALARHFDVTHRVDYGGALSVLVLDEIVSNFHEDDERAMRWFQRVLDADRRAWQRGRVPSANAVLVGRK